MFYCNICLLLFLLQKTMTKILQIFKIAVCFLIEQVMRIELTSSAWQADALTVVLYLQILSE